MRTACARTLILAACLLAGAAGSCGSDQPSPEPDPPRVDLVVGDTIALTGPSAGLGASAQKAAQLAVEQINDAIAKADVPHAVEIVHRDSHAEGASTATAELLESGVSCVVGPRSRAGMRRVARASAGKALVISPRIRSARLPGVERGLVAWLPPTGPQRAIDPEGGDGDPAASFARLYESTDPPIGPARTSDGRQFDATILCYLAAVSAGSGRPRQMASRLGPASRGALSYSWAQLPEAIEDLERGRAIVYSGITVRLGVHPRSPEEGPP
jgi:hypothetical protein